MKKLILLSVLIILLLGGFYLYKNKNFAIQGLPLDKNITSSDSQSSQNIVNIGGFAIQGEGDMSGVKIEQIDIVNDKSAVKISVPDLDREIKTTGDINEDVARISAEKIKDISSQLKKDSDNLENWLVLGIYRKMINDYEGAILAWEYAGKIRPQSGIPSNNLGDLYAYYLKDTLNAEKYFLQAIRNEPNNIYFYFKIVDFYRDFEKDMSKARAVLEQGIANNPNTSSDLKKLLESLK